MQYPFTEEQLAIARLTQDFMEREVAPVAAEIDARPNPVDCYPGELISKASRLGLRALAVPEEYGGGGTDYTTRTLALWTGGQVEVGTIKCLSQCWKVSSAIAKGGSKDQKERWLKRFVEDDGCVCSIALTEPDHSTENRLHGGDPRFGLQSTAVRDGDWWILNGVKRFTSLIGFSKIILFFARTDPRAPVNKGTTCFLLRGDEQGIRYGRLENKMGYRLYPNGESFYENVRVHKDDILGEVNGGYAVRAAAFRGSAELSACNTGLCRALFNFAHQHAKERIQGGKPIIEHPTVRSMLAEMVMDIEVAEQFMWRVCWGVDHDETYNSRFTRSQKLFSDKVGMRCIALAVDVIGGMAIMRDCPTEKVIRDIITFQHADGTGSAVLLEAGETLDRPA